MRRKYQVPKIASSEVTSETAYLNRRQFIGGTAGALAVAGLPQVGHAARTGGKALDYSCLLYTSPSPRDA